MAHSKTWNCLAVRGSFTFCACACACAESSLHPGRVKSTFMHAGGLGDWPCSPDRGRGQSPLLSRLHCALQPAASSCTWTGARVIVLLVGFSAISLVVLVLSSAFGVPSMMLLTLDALTATQHAIAVFCSRFAHMQSSHWRCQGVSRGLTGQEVTGACQDH